MYHDERLGAAIGLHLGYLCDRPKPVSRYMPAECFNYGRYVTAELMAMIQGVVDERLDISLLVTPQPMQLRPGRHADAGPAPATEQGQPK
ncbi:hypothetical protein [Rhizorhabdus sp. FW153]|uniref:hypothetical protein n=1 Tax=Rhizorhabdus sp. FW153 TaxID=3400216 RepID=UPI003CE8D1CB